MSKVGWPSASGDCEGAQCWTGDSRPSLIMRSGELLAGLSYWLNSRVREAFWANPRDSLIIFGLVLLKRQSDLQVSWI